jgi:hypothetical protein
MRARLLRRVRLALGPEVCGVAELGSLLTDRGNGLWAAAAEAAALAGTTLDSHGWWWYHGRVNDLPRPDRSTG